MGIREDNRARMFQAIQEAALDLVEANGLDATTVADIAARVGIAERTFFRYYATKVDALMPGQRGLVEALVEHESAQTSAAGITKDLLAASREVFACEVEQRDFRRISRLLIREPELLRIVSGQEQDLVKSISGELHERGALPHLSALLVAEVVTAVWRVAWHSFARDDVAGLDPDPLALFDQTVRELGGLLPGA